MVRVESDETKNRKIEKSMKTEVVFLFLQVSVKLTNGQPDSQRHRRDTNTIIWNERKAISIDYTNIKSLMREYYEQLYTHKFDCLDEIA